MSIYHDHGLFSLETPPEKLVVLCSFELFVRSRLQNVDGLGIKLEGTCSHGGLIFDLRIHWRILSGVTPHFGSQNNPKSGSTVMLGKLPINTKQLVRNSLVDHWDYI